MRRTMMMTTRTTRTTTKSTSLMLEEERRRSRRRGYYYRSRPSSSSSSSMSSSSMPSSSSSSSHLDLVFFPRPRRPRPRLRLQCQNQRPQLLRLSFSFFCLCYSCLFVVTTTWWVVDGYLLHHHHHRLPVANHRCHHHHHHNHRRRHRHYHYHHYHHRNTRPISWSRLAASGKSDVAEDAASIVINNKNSPRQERKKNSQKPPRKRRPPLKKKEEDGTETEKKAQRRLDHKPQRKSWKQMFPRLQDYYRRHGHSNVTVQHDDDDEHQDLFEWTTNLRNNYRSYVLYGTDGAGNKLTLTNHRRRRQRQRQRRQELSNRKLQALREVDFSWHTFRPRRRRLQQQFEQEPPSKNSNGRAAVPKRNNKTWKEYYPKLEAFHRLHGHSNVTLQHPDDADTSDLCEWVRRLRRRFRFQVTETTTPKAAAGAGGRQGDPSSSSSSKRTRLSDEKMQMLAKLDFEWYPTKDSNFELYSFTKGTRKRLKSRAQKWNQQWNRKYQRLKKFADQNGHCRVRTVDDPQLADFVQYQRKLFGRLLAGQSTTLTEDRIEALEEIGFEWGQNHDIRWRDRIRDFEAFQKIYGTAHVPQKFAENEELGRWVMNQRSHYTLREKGRYSALRKDRIAQLEELNIVWNYRQEEASKYWRAMLNWAKTYQLEQGHLNISMSDTAHTRLRYWLNNQRVLYKLDNEDDDDNDDNEDNSSDQNQGRRRRLSPDQIKDLEAIPGFRWRIKGSKYPTKADWSKLFDALHSRGIRAGAKAKKHWFEGVNPLQEEVKSVWTDEELLALWNEENEENDEDDSEDDYYEDEDSRLFLRA